jgi:hypothetical protein
LRKNKCEGKNFTNTDIKSYQLNPTISTYHTEFKESNEDANRVIDNFFK